MELLKKSIYLLIIFVSIQTSAQQVKQLQEAFKKSYTLESEYNYSESIKILSSFTNPPSYEVHLRLGWLNYLSGKYAESVVAYSEASKQMPASTEALWGMVNTLAAMEKWQELEKIYLSILKLDPKNQTAALKLGSIYYYRKDYPNAKKYYDIVLNLSPFNYEGLLMSAWTRYFLGNTSDAKVLFNKVLLYQPDDASALEGLSLIK